MSKPAEIYIGERIIVRKDEGAGGAVKNAVAIYFKPDNAPKYSQLDLTYVKSRSGKITYQIGSIFHGVGLPKKYDKLDMNIIDTAMLQTFDLLDSLFEE